MTTVTIGPQSRLSVGHLVVRQEDEDEYIVGDAAAGIFFSVPEIGARIIELLAAGSSVAEAAAELERRTGDDVDVAGFAEDLVAAGVVPELDGAAVPGHRAVASSRTSRIPARWARPLFGRIAWAVYALCFAASLAIFFAEPELVPTYEDVFFSTDVLLSLIMANVVMIGLAFVHEIWHALAGAALGVESRFHVRRRAYFPVFETDLTALWTVPPEQRYGPFLAGLGIDAVVMFGALAVRFAWMQSWISLPGDFVRVLGMVVVGQAVKMAFQALAFLRTDLYMVLLTATGTRNLHGIALLLLKKRVRRLTDRETTTLGAAHPRDLAWARWYRVLYLAGVTWLIWFSYYYLWPSLRVIVGWSWNVLIAAPIGSTGWWEAIVIAVLAAVDLAFPVWVTVRDRRARRKESPI